MQARTFQRVGGLAVFCLVAGLIGSASGNGSDNGQLNALVALHQLQADFHGATALADEDLMRSLWADDAVFHSPKGDLYGPDEITDFLVSSPRWGKCAALSPAYKTTFDVKGNTATFYFECVFVEVDVANGADPVNEILSTVPFGAQNPTVEIVQHSLAAGKAVKSGNRWVFKEFGHPAE
jgi:hypothetical protein